VAAVARAAPGAGSEVELSRLRRRRVELDADVQRRTRERMSSEAAVAVPGEVGQTLHRACRLEHARVPVGAIQYRAQGLVGEGHESAQLRMIAQLCDGRRGEAQVDEAAEDLLSVRALRPPRTPVARPRGSGVRVHDITER